MPQLAKVVACGARMEPVLGKRVRTGQQPEPALVHLDHQRVLALQIEQSHIVSSGKSVSISNRTAPQ